MANVPHSLSVCMIVKNEAANIRGALESFAAFADEIVVVDTGSTDGTADLALSFTPHVYRYTWHDDFAAARNFSLEKAGCAYCLWMDADDRVDALNAAKINALKREFDGRRAFAFELHDIRNGAPFRFLMQIRCFPNRQDVRFKGRIHESIDWDRVQDVLVPVNVDIVVTHHGYDDPVLLARKINRNIRLLQMEYEAGRDDATLHYYLAMSFSHIGNGRAAIDHMGRALHDLEKKLFHAHGREAETLRTFRLDAQLFLVQEMLGLERRDDARRLLAKLSCEPDPDPLTLFRIGAFYQSLNAHGDALQFFARVDPDKQTATVLPSPKLRRTEIAARIAFSLFCCGNRDQALSQIRSLADPDDRKEAWEIVGILASETGRHRLGAMAFEQALSLGGLTASGWEQWGVVWDRIGDPRRAEQCWR
ncbi:MAG: glycosyltransferase family 2 protein, partial [Desulfacinum sp.]|nr:glycosyltransferase family 2 protein [Desulfacinum sp.]